MISYVIISNEYIEGIRVIRVEYNQQIELIKWIDLVEGNFDTFMVLTPKQFEQLRNYDLNKIQFERLGGKNE